MRAGAGPGRRPELTLTDLARGPCYHSGNTSLTIGMMNAVSRLYGRYAAGLLALTLLAGVYLRAAFTWPALRGTMNGPYMVHAHSHTGFFGWAVMVVFAVVAARLVFGRAGELLHRVLAHAIGLGTVAAFVGFALRGYDTVTITLSAMHVLLWLVFAVAAWSGIRSVSAVTTLYLRAALLFLVTAGLATTAPVLMMVRGVGDPWLLQLGVKLFLTPFVTGFLLLAALAMVYERIAAPRFARSVLAGIAAGTVPSTLLYVAAAPPVDWLVLVGRGGMLLIATGTLLFVADVLRASFARGAAAAAGPETPVRPVVPPLPPLAWLTAAAATAVAGLELLAAAGVGASFMHNRAISVAVLHLVLLGVVTPTLLLGVRPGLHAPRRTLAYAAALLLMLVPLGVTGWPWAARTLVLSGVPFPLLFTLAAVGGVLAAVLLLTLVLPSPATASAAVATPAATPAASTPAAPAAAASATPAAAVPSARR
jgi:hypothetical protein